MFFNVFTPDGPTDERCTYSVKQLLVKQLLVKQLLVKQLLVAQTEPNLPPIPP